MAIKKPSPQAMGRVSTAQKEGLAQRDKMINQMQASSVRGSNGGDGAKGTIPATYGQDKLQKKLTPVQRLQNKMSAERKNPVNALAMNRSAKAKDSTATSKPKVK